MTPRLLIRIIIAACGFVALATAGLAVAIVATSAPALPPRPLPTATAQPGPNATPKVPLPRLPTATAQPGPDATAKVPLPRLPTATPRPIEDPNGQVQAAADGSADAATLTGLTYEAPPRHGAAGSACSRDGHWLLEVNPQDVVGHPFATPPSKQDWARAADAIGEAIAICPADVVLSWVGHDRAHPASDSWTASLPAPRADGIDGPALRQYALRYARQL